MYMLVEGGAGGGGGGVDTVKKRLAHVVLGTKEVFGL